MSLGTRASVSPGGAAGGEPSAGATAPPPFEISGPRGAPVVVALGGISATRHVVSTADDPAPGWWESVAGPGAPLDTARLRVLGVDFLDGGRTPRGRPARVVTTDDQAAALAALLDHLGIARVHAVVGASYGGMVALSFAASFPERLERLVVIGAAHESHPMSTALRSIQRGIVELGLETGRVHDAMALARGLAMTTYRTSREFAARFAAEPVDRRVDGATFEVERYLAHHGRRFAERFAAERFLALSLSGDLHRVDPACISAPTLLVAAEDDRIVPAAQIEELARRLAGPVRLERLASRFGHDAFLREPEAIGRLLDTVLLQPPLS